MASTSQANTYKTQRVILRGGQLITPLEVRYADLQLSEGLIAAISDFGSSNEGDKILDVSGCYVTPGLFDIQINGGPNCNLWADPTKDEIKAFGSALLRSGVTSILPTLITDEIDHLKNSIAQLKKFGAGAGLDQPNMSSAQTATATEMNSFVRMPGIHLEGPFLSSERAGVHPTQYIKPLNLEAVRELLDDAIKLITLAPEFDPTGVVISYLSKKKIVVSLGHSNCTFEEANRAFSQGVSMVTHIFNACPPLHQRAPGAVAAALLADAVSCGIICDGHHVDPAMVQLALKLKGVDKIILVTDAAKIGTTSGGLVGSSITLDQAVRNLDSWGVATFAQAIKMASWNPACALGMETKIGHIECGKFADLTVWDRNSLAVKHVIVGGQIVF